VPRDYGSHADYMRQVAAEADARQVTIENELREAFSGFLENREVEVVAFLGMRALDLARAPAAHLLTLTPPPACCNVATGSIKRDPDRLIRHTLHTYPLRSRHSILALVTTGRELYNSE